MAIPTETAERVERVALTIRLFNEAVEKLERDSDFERTEGLELLEQRSVDNSNFLFVFATQRAFPCSVQAYPRESALPRAVIDEMDRNALWYYKNAFAIVSKWTTATIYTTE